MVDGLFFCATLTGRRGGHTPFVQAGVETSDTGAEAVESDPGAQPGGGMWGICLPPRNFQNSARIKMKFYILITSKKSYWNFSLSCSLIISLQDLSGDRLSDRKFRI